MAKSYNSELKYFIKRFISDGWRYRKRIGYGRFISDIFYELLFKIKNPKFKYLIKINAEDLDDIPQENVNHSGQCESNSSNALRGVFHHLKDFVHPNKTTFIDIGSGVGRVLLEAKNNNFKKVVGLEQSETLVEIAKKNLFMSDHIQKNDNLLCLIADVTDCNFTTLISNSEDIILLFLANPFDDKVLAAFLKNYLKQIKNKTYIAYTYKQYPELLKTFGFKIIFEKRIKNKFTLESYRIYSNANEET